MNQSKNDTDQNTLIITKQTAQRLAKDIRGIRKNSLESMGIHYIHDDTNMLKGYALIIGPQNTVYEGGYFLFNVDFPMDYPHSPPKFTYLTNDGETRMNPNLYRNGKVCLSILNTWHGEPWSGCQTISSVLLSICSGIFTNTPLLNEPGITVKNIDYNKYNTIIEHQTFKVGMIQMLKNCPILKFHDIIKNHFIENYDSIIARIEKKCSDKENKIAYRCATKIYDMNITINYNFLKTEFSKLNELLTVKLK